MNHILHNYRSDIALVENFYRYDEVKNELVATEIPDIEIDFEFTYRAEDNREFTAGRKAGAYFNCKPISNNSIEVYIPLSRCQLGTGILAHFLNLHTPNENFPEQIQNICVPASTGYMLHKGPSAPTTTAATSILGSEVFGRAFTIGILHDTQKENPYYFSDDAASVRTMQRYLSADRETTRILFVLLDVQTGEKSCALATIINDCKESVPDGGQRNLLMLGGEMRLGNKFYRLQLFFDKESKTFDKIVCNLPSGTAQTTGDDPDWTMSQQAITRELTQVRTDFAEGDRLTLQSAEKYTNTQLTEHDASDSAHAAIRNLFKPGATISEATAALAALGSNYKDVYTLASTLKSFLEAHDTAESTINTWREIEDFLGGLTDRETLTGLMEQEHHKLIADFDAKLSALDIANIPDIPWSKLTSKPTTIAGYGITDAVTLNTEQTITARKTFSDGIVIGDALLVWDAENNAVKVVGKDGNTAVDFYSVGGVSALEIADLSIGGGGATALSELTDVALSLPSINDLLVYNGSKWINTPMSSIRPDLTGYAMQSWVTGQGYLTAAALANYVTLNTEQTIEGAKTFTNKLIVSGNGINDNGLYMYEFPGTTTCGGYILYGQGDQLHLGTWNNSETGIDALSIGRGSADVTFLGRIIKSGGTSAQFLKADGSVDNTQYLPTTGGTISSSTPGLVNFKSTGRPEVFIEFSSADTHRMSIGWYNGFSYISSEPNYTGLPTDNFSRIGITDDGIPQYWTDRDTKKYNLWHSGNDGAGSGLDADLLDGVHEYEFFRSNRFEIPNSYVDITNYQTNASGYANYPSGTYIVNRSSHYDLLVNFALNEGSASALQFYSGYMDSSDLKFRKTIDSNRVSGPWRVLVSELNIGKYNAGSATRLQTPPAPSGVRASTGRGTWMGYFC